MTVAGIIAEYNPLHNGHQYHINMTKKLTGAQYIICVMSGNFVQRGETAIINKWFRTRMALEAGIDLVIELPTVYALQSAEQFALGAVKLLDSTGIVDCLCFGSEAGDISLLAQATDLLHSEPAPLKQLIKQKMAEGLSYPHAIAEALSCYAQVDIALTPNNILGVEYLKALKTLNSPIKPVTIQRLHSSYNSAELEGKISSATSIRHAIYKHGLTYDGVRYALPGFTYTILADAFDKGYGPVFSKGLEQLMIYTLRNMSENDIAGILDVTEGLEHRLKKAADLAGDLPSLIRYIKTKRYTQARIQRILIRAMLGITSDLMKKLAEAGGPQYIRILGFSDKGKDLLPYIKAKAKLPLLSKAADYRYLLPPSGKEIFEIDVKATDLYSLIYPKTTLRRAGNEFIQDIYHI